MSQLNKAFQYVVRLFNYKTYIEGKGYMTANLINVYERYYDMYKSYSEVKKMDIWTDILAKWFNSYQNRVIRDLNRKLQGKIIFKFPAMYYNVYRDFETNFKYDLKAGLLLDKSAYDLHHETNFDTLKYLHEDYMTFINDLNYVVREMDKKINYKEIEYNPKFYTWYESKEIIPGHYSDITKLHHHNHQFYRVHPALLDLY